MLETHPSLSRLIQSGVTICDWCPNEKRKRQVPYDGVPDIIKHRKRYRPVVVSKMTFMRISNDNIQEAINNTLCIIAEHYLSIYEGTSPFKRMSDVELFREIQKSPVECLEALKESMGMKDDKFIWNTDTFACIVTPIDTRFRHRYYLPSDWKAHCLFKKAKYINFT